MPNAGAPVLVGDVARWYTVGEQSTLQSGIPNATFTAIQMNAADPVDTLGIHDPVTNNSRFVIGLALGWWWVHGNIAWGVTTAAKRYAAQLALNGAVIARTAAYAHASIADALNTQTMGLVQAVAATDYVELMGRHDLGAGLTMSTSVSGYRSSLTCVYLGP